MKIGSVVKDKENTRGQIDQIFGKRELSKTNKYRSVFVPDAYLIKVSEKHYLYRKVDDVKLVKY